MPPNKKKKKTANNSARGFATTSTPSKLKVDDEKEKDIDNQNTEFEPSGVSIAQPANSFVSAITGNAQKELHELTPEELEFHLEESHLQLLLEEYGEKCKKEASRQVNRLSTERRVLRPQAERLDIRAWLPDELVQEILNLLKNQVNNTNLDIESVRAQANSEILESDLMNKLWTLEKVLGQLGFNEVRIRSVLISLLKRWQSSKPIMSKDSIWGLDECFDHLILICEPEEIPAYGSQAAAEGRPKKNKSVEHDKTYGEYDPTISSASAAIGPTQPRPGSSSRPESKSSSADGTSASENESESDDSTESGTSIKRYLNLQTRILQLQPDFLKREPTKSKAKPNTKLIEPIPKVAKLLAKVSKITSDILFDEDEAYAQWVQLRNEILQASADRKKYQLDQGKRVGSPTARKPPSIQNTTAGMGEDEEQFDMMGDLFSSLPETTSDLESGASSLVSRGKEGQIVTIRDFGRWTGMNPRRVFEEACKARDASCKITFNVVSESTFAYQQSLLVEWSCNQAPSRLIHDKSITCEATDFFAKFQMTTIATPDTLQSEAYISTVALYLLFGHSPKEEKAYLRLPPQWRDLWMEMTLFEREHNDTADRDSLRQLRNIIEACKSEAELSTFNEHSSAKKSSQRDQSDTTEKAETRLLSAAVLTENMTQKWLSKSSSSQYCEMLKSRVKLPIWNFKDQLLRAIESNQVVIVCGETGCGKSTQVPAFILEHQLTNNLPCKVYCTEPRRISAISLARRVSEELGEQRMDIGTSRSMVGYAIRLESKITDETRLVYATTGIVMRMLERSDDLGSITHLVLDEVHERSLDNDFLLIVLRKLMLRRPELKVILMSATVDAGRFSSYLGEAPIMNVPGRTFPVETKYLEDVVEITEFSQEEASSRDQIGDYSDNDDMQETSVNKNVIDNLKGYSAKARKTLAKLDEYRIEYGLIIKLLETVAHRQEFSSYSKAILVFLPGIAEIRRLSNMIQSHPSFSQGWNICALHSTIATEEQERAFLIPPPGMRKIVLATNIAETGITIPDVTCVVDTGKHKEMRFDERRQLSRLIETFISRANAKQRRGRAGRVQKGICFHLYTKARHDSLMLEEQRPEMLRLSLQDLVLRVKICKLGGIEQTLSEALDPPSSKNIQRAINALVDVKALTTKEELTSLGRQLARLPLDVFLGKLLLLGTLYQCLDVALSTAAILSSKSPFSAPMGSRSQVDAARLAFKKGDSDLLTVYNAYSAWRKTCNSAGGLEQQFCRKNCLSSQTLSNVEELKAQLMTSIVDAGFVTLNETEKTSLNRVRFSSTNKKRFVEVPERYSLNDTNELTLNSVIAWSFYPKLLSRNGKGWKNVVNNQNVSLHPTSVNKTLDQSSKWLSYYHIMQSTNKFYNAHETSAVESMGVVLGCGDAEFKMYAGIIIIDGNRIRFKVDTWRAMLALKTLRTQMRMIMAQFFRRPGLGLTAEQRAWMDVWQRVFATREESGGREGGGEGGWLGSQW